MLQNTEKRLLKDEKQAETYQSQKQDMLERDVAKRLDETNMNSGQELRWTGALY